MIDRVERARSVGVGVGVLAALPILLFARLALCDPPRPDVVLITLDTTRADRLGCYGYPRDTSPNLDRLAQQATVYTRAYSTTSWTLPAHASLFTGRFATSHGARLDSRGGLALSDGIAGPDALEGLRARGLSPEQPTLAGILSGAGYTTAGIVAGPWMKRVFTLDRGFDHYDDAEIGSVKGRLASQVTDAAIAWLEKAERPFFLFLNYYDPHVPYEDPEGQIRHFLPKGTRVWPPPEPMTRVYRNAAYDAEIRYMDGHLGRLLDHLDERGLADDAWIVVTSDHGELLGEHTRLGHGRTLYEEEIRIPLIVKRPGDAEAPHRSDRPLQLTDVLPMLLGALDLPLPPGIANEPGGGPVFAEVRPLAHRGDGEWRAWIRGDHKLLWNNRGNHQLFDLSAEGAEDEDLASRDPERVRAMNADLDAFLAGLPVAGPAGESAPVSAETRRALEALGYLE
jgi:arylsulfatase A-like enzyme